MEEGTPAPSLSVHEPAQVEVVVVQQATSLLLWLRAGLRVVCFRAPPWSELTARPVIVAVLLLAIYLNALVVERALIEGTARFYWTGALAGWAAFAVSVWLCWIVARSAARSGSQADLTATLITVLCSAWVVYGVALSVVLLALRAMLGGQDDWPGRLSWSVWLLQMAWIGLFQVRLLWRVVRNLMARIAVVLLTALQLLLNGWLSPIAFWWPAPAAESSAEAEGYKGLSLTEEVVTRQPQLLSAALDNLSPPKPGQVNVYAATYAPYATEDVFMRESAAVTKTMRERFGADGRLIELVVNPATGTTLPWAMPTNLRKTLKRMADVMDRDRDVLFLHLTSHGGSDGQLATNTWPLETDTLTPAMLKQWLDEAGIRWRVISISACYSGSWIAPLAGDGTLVMTAADATHTSYGCGRRSPLTFFGQAMYVEALRSTWSFEDAHAQARKLIETREQTAGKTDGYSNPQISVGAGIRPVLQRLQAERAAAAR